MLPMTTNLRLKNPTCRAHIFQRLLSYVFHQINNFIMVLIETVDQKYKNPRLRELAAKNSRARDAKKHKKTTFRDSFKTPPRFRDWSKNFRDPEFSGYHSPPLLCTILKFNFFKFTTLIVSVIERISVKYTWRISSLNALSIYGRKVWFLVIRNDWRKLFL